MSIYYNPSLVKLLQEERIREAQEANFRRYPALENDSPKSAFVTVINSVNPFRRQSPAEADCTC